MTPENPYETLTLSVEVEQCDLAGCTAPWAWEAERRNGPRKLRLCEEHSTKWLNAERALDEEIVAVAAKNAVREDLAAVTERVDRLSKQIRGSAAAGRRAQPGTKKALDTLGRGDDKRRRARRRLS